MVAVSRFKFFCNNVKSWVFVQDILRLPDMEVMVKGRITGASLNPKGRPFAYPELDHMFG